MDVVLLECDDASKEPRVTARPEGRADQGQRFAVRGRLAVDGSLVAGAVVVEGGTIVDVRRGGVPDGDLPSQVHDTSIVAPGLIDLQVNGAFGVEVGTSAEALRHLAAQLPTTGVTGFLPTLVSSPPDLYPRAFEAFEEARDATGATPIGLHLEGPFLSSKRAGAHRVKAIHEASAETFQGWLGAGSVRLVTLAPEREGAGDRIRRLRERGIVVSLGHTNATYEEFREGVDRGATMATHLYSAMSGFLHRAPGAVGAALLDDRVTAGLIVDGVHSHPASVRLAIRAKGPDRIALVTDAIAGAGTSPGVYQIDGQDILVEATFARLPDGTLAGSVLTLDQAVRNAVSLGGASVADALRMASEVPARVLGLAGKGRLALGADADLVLFDEELAVLATYGGGRALFRRDAAPASSPVHQSSRA
jgi:N-acetylglucosamine-6-phosphate deacetylase